MYGGSEGRSFLLQAGGARAAPRFLGAKTQHQPETPGHRGLPPNPTHRPHLDKQSGLRAPLALKPPPPGAAPENSLTLSRGQGRETDTATRELVVEKDRARVGCVWRGYPLPLCVSPHLVPLSECTSLSDSLFNLKEGACSFCV